MRSEGLRQRPRNQISKRRQWLLEAVQCMQQFGLLGGLRRGPSRTLILCLDLAFRRRAVGGWWPQKLRVFFGCCSIKKIPKVFFRFSPRNSPRNSPRFSLLVFPTQFPVPTERSLYSIIFVGCFGPPQNHPPNQKQHFDKSQI